MELDILKQNTTWNDARASINNNFAKVKTALEQGGGGGGSIAVDEEMSDTSEKAVQNKVIKKYVDDEVEDAKAYSEEMADNAEKAAKKYADEKISEIGGGISEETEVYIGEEEPTDDGAKLWVDVNDESGETSGGNGGNAGGINVFVFPQEVGSSDYTSDNPYVFSAEKSAELLAALKKRDTIYLMAVVMDASSPVEMTQSVVVNMIYMPQADIFQSQNILYQSGFLSIVTIHLKVNNDGIVSGYNENVVKQL